mmetsp:Transcript_2646/g.10154  ORF Transcript_2646/g.10154 Transcript_2646/m.10154 type:complete len:243 (-) Transcript_2646:212-940(-)
MCLAPMPTSLFSASCALKTLGTFNKGSPIPMNTTFVTLVPKCSSSATTWSTISCAAKFRANPPFPVAQNTHRIGHPTCEETHAVNRFLPFSVAGIPTVSTTRSSCNRKSSFTVPSVAAATVCTSLLPICTFRSFNESRTVLGNAVRSSIVLTGVGPYKWSRICLPRKEGKPLSTANVFNSASVKPRRWNLGSARDARSASAEGAAGKTERAYVARASLKDCSTKRASASFHSPSWTPLALGT